MLVSRSRGVSFDNIPPVTSKLDVSMLRNRRVESRYAALSKSILKKICEKLQAFTPLLPTPVL